MRYRKENGQWKEVTPLGVSREEFDEVKQDLTHNYYTKTETDNKIGWKLISSVETVTTTEVDHTLPSGNKFSDYTEICVLAQANGTVRGSLVIPVVKFRDLQDCYVLTMIGSTIASLYIKDLSDTTYRISGSDSRLNYMRIYAR